MNIFLTDHKCGSNLITKIAEVINETIYPSKFKEINSLIPQSNKFIHRYMDPTNYDLKKFCKELKFYFSDACLVRFFYLFWQDYNIFHKYIICIRDPREIIISGYLYHKQCQEIWAINNNYNYYHGWKENHFRDKDLRKNKEYINFCNLFSKDISYKEKLLGLDVHDGLIHEMNHVAFLTLTGMGKFNFIEKSNVFILKMENILTNFEQSFQSLLDFLKIQENKRLAIYDKVSRFNLKRNSSIKLNLITNKNLNIDRYKVFFNKKINSIFINKYEYLLKKYNY